MRSALAGLSLVALLVAASPGPATAQQPEGTVRRVVIMRFAIAGEASTRSDGLSARACPAADAASTSALPVLDPDLLDALTVSLQQRLAKSMTVSIVTDPRAVPSDALVLVGCIVRVDAGDAAKRMVGAFIGASHLDAHIQLLSPSRGGFEPIHDFDIKSRGGNLLPPLSPMGLAMRTATMSNTALKSDIPKLSYKIERKVFAYVYPDRYNDTHDDDED